MNIHIRLFIMGRSNGGVSEYQYDSPADGWKVSVIDPNIQGSSFSHDSHTDVSGLSGPLRACYHTDKISQDISSFVMGKDLKDDPIYGVMWTRPNVSSLSDSANP